MLKIISVVVNGYRKFKVSAIEDLNIRFDRDTHVILGSNGSGKSSLMDLLLPKAHTKTFFDKTGFLDLVLTDGVNEYGLSYSRKHGHSFKINREERNGSRISNIQSELIDKRFGLDKTRCDILRCKLDIVNMRPSVRKTTLSEISPIDITIFIEEQKVVRKACSEVESQLKLLRDRQQQISSQLIDQTSFERFKSQHGELTSKESQYVIKRAEIETLLRDIELGPKPPMSTEQEFNDAFQAYRLRWWDEFEGDLDNERSQLPLVVANFRESLTTIGDKIVAINEEIEKRRMELTKESSSGRELLKTQEQIEEQLKGLPEMEHFIPESTAKRCEAIIHQIKDQCDNLSHLSTKPMEAEKVIALGERISTLRSSINYTNSEIQVLHEKYKELMGNVRDYVIPNGCPRSDCELLEKYMEHRETNQSRAGKIAVERQEKERSLREAQKELEEKLEIYEEQRLCSEIVNNIIDRLMSEPVLQNCVTPNDVRDLINRGAFVIHQQLQQFSDDSAANRRRLILEEDLAKVREQIKHESNSSSINKGHLRRGLTALEKKREALLRSYEKYDFKIQDKEAKLAVVADRARKQEKMAEVVKNADYLVEYLEKKTMKEFYEACLVIIKEELATIRTKLADIDQTLSQQESLRDRLENEIKSSIAVLEPKKTMLRKIEKSLKDLQLIYVKTFLNNLIHLTNTYLEEITTYEIRLEEIVDDDITFKFPAMIDGHIMVDDIRDMSDAQKTMVELCFTLALISETKMHGYPLFLDEIDRTLDEAHRLRTLAFLDGLIDKAIISQLFVVNHHPDLHSALVADCTVLDASNITLPPEYNQNTLVVRAD